MASQPKLVNPLPVSTVIGLLGELETRAGDMARSTIHRQNYLGAHRRLKSLLSSHLGLGVSKSLDTLLSSFLQTVGQQSESQSRNSSSSTC